MRTLDRMGFVWMEWALRGLRGVEPHEVHQVLSGRRRPVPASEAIVGIKVMTFWGRTTSGRPLIVAARHVGQWDWMLIGARDMTSEEISEFERWENQ